MVLDAALGLFARDGYEAVSMQQIGEAAGVSKPVVYSCFPSKEELFTELLRREDRRLWRLVENAIPGDSAVTDVHDGLRAVLTELLSAVVAAPESFQVLVLQPSGERPRRARAQWVARLTEILAARTRLSEREACVMGRLLVAAAEIGFATMLEDPAAWDPTELAGFLADTLDRGLSRPATA
jgi:AcrR family transcriptional regulator